MILKAPHGFAVYIAGVSNIRNIMSFCASDSNEESPEFEPIGSNSGETLRPAQGDMA